MPMQMTRDPSSRHIRDIHAKIEPLWPHGLHKRDPDGFQDIEEFRLLRRVHLRKTIDVPLGHDHEMAIIVRIPVEDHGVMTCPEEDKISFVFFLPQQAAKKTAGAFTGARAQVDLAPRSPHKVRGSLEVHGFLHVRTK